MSAASPSRLHRFVVKFVDALLAADAGELHPAEWDAGEVAGRSVDPDVAGLELQVHMVRRMPRALRLIRHG
jgi:hypothetical protein